MLDIKKGYIMFKGYNMAKDQIPSAPKGVIDDFADASVPSSQSNRLINGRHIEGVHEDESTIRVHATWGCKRSSWIQIQLQDGP